LTVDGQQVCPNGTGIGLRRLQNGIESPDQKDPWELSLGKQYTPFGVYFSSFVSGPLLEFGETQADAVATLAYGPSDKPDILLTAYHGRARKQGKNSG
jgi:hypothetical protein